MRSLKPVIASNGFAILLTVVFLLPIMAIFLFVVTTPIDSILAKFGLWLHGINEWSFPEFDTEERFSKIGFAIRSVLIVLENWFCYSFCTYCCWNIISLFLANKLVEYESCRL